MRPLELTIEGLRSFRERIEIDFADRELVAVVGDTGVGKSSILEAIVYALYAGSTWTAHNRELIADTADTMLVRLRFESGGRCYTIERSNSRGNRPARAQLTSHDEGTAIDGVSEVNRAVEQLVGLDRDTFLKSVVLPQGRFAELLVATPAERNVVLRNIFRVDVLDSVHAGSKTVRDRVFPHVEGLRQRLAALPDDPRQAVDAARAARRGAGEAEARLATALEAAEALEARRATARTEVGRLRELRARLDEVEVDGFEATLRDRRDRAGALEAEGRRVEQAEAAVGERLEGAKARRAALVADGLDRKELVAAATTLRSLTDQLAELADGVEVLHAERRDISALEARVAALADELEVATGAAAEAVAARDRARASVEAADETLARAKDAYDSAIESREWRDAARTERAEADEAVAAARARLDAARADEAAAADRLTAAVSALDDLDRRHAAAHAARGRGPGDPCPVCERELPAGFEPPEPPELTDARAARDEAERDHERRQEVTIRADAASVHAREALGAVEQRVKAAETDEAASVRELASCLGASEVDLATPVDTLLGEQRAVVERARSEADEAKRLADAATGARDEARLAHGREQQRLESEQKRVADRHGTADRQRRRLVEAVEGLPEPFRPELGELGDVEALDPSVLRGATVTTSAAEVEARLGELEAADDELEAARDERDELGARRAEHDARLAEEVTEPLQELRADLQRAADALEAVGRAAGGTATTIRIPARELEAGVTEVRERRDTVASELGGLVAEAAAAEDAARAELGRELAANGLEDLPTLVVRLRDQRVELRAAEQELERAESQLEVAQELQAKVGVGVQLVDDLDALRKLVADFVADVLKRRSQALLAVASRRLDEMTAGRYAFTDEFSVLDQLTGQPRRAETLSGGESFLASLALALGMVDLAARAGGRLEALFLDEGFGALDNANLGAAVDALEAAAREGRMVGVVSHVKAVADRIEDVLVVVDQPGGSKVRWLDDDERSVVSDVDLRAAMAGLLE